MLLEGTSNFSDKADSPKCQTLRVSIQNCTHSVIILNRYGLISSVYRFCNPPVYLHMVISYVTVFIDIGCKDFALHLLSA